MKKEKGPLTKLWTTARKQIKEKQLKQLEETLDKGVMYLAFYSMQNIGDKELLEGVKKEVWHERFWMAIENHIWPTRADYEENWKM
jgi:hypothetical protein